MVGETWSSTSKICDAFKTAQAGVFCQPDSNIHAANKLLSRHARVFVCEQAPASVTCKANAAALCTACDRDIHSVNHLAHRHERLPVIPFFNAASAMRSSPSTAIIGDEYSEEEVEAASWLLNDSNSKVDDESESPEYKYAEYLFNDLDPACLDLDLISYEQKPKNRVMNEKEQYHCSDGVVPVHQRKNEVESDQIPGPVVEGFPTCEVNYPGSKPFMYKYFSSQSICQSTVSSSSLDVGFVPDHNPANTFATKETIAANPRCPGSRGKRGCRGTGRKERTGGSKKPSDIPRERPMRRRGRELKAGLPNVQSSKLIPLKSYRVVPTF